MTQRRIPMRLLQRVIAAGIVCGASYAAYRHFDDVAPPPSLAFDDQDEGIITQEPTDATLPSEARRAAEAMAEAELMEADCASEIAFCVGLVTDVGRVDDGTHNEDAWQVLQTMSQNWDHADQRFQVDVVETARVDDLAANIELLADDHYDVIITVGSSSASATAALAATVPTTHFIGIDQPSQPTLTNFTAITGMETATASALLQLAAEASSAKVVGVIVPPSIDPLHDVFVAGVDAVAASAGVEVVVRPQPTLRSGPAASWAPGIIDQLVAEGADVFVTLGLQDGRGVLETVASRVPDALCFGHGADRFVEAERGQSCIVTSIKANLATTLQQAVELLAAGSSAPATLPAQAEFAPFRPLNEGVNFDNLGAEEGATTDDTDSDDGPTPSEPGRTFPDLEELARTIFPFMES